MKYHEMRKSSHQFFSTNPISIGNIDYKCQWAPYEFYITKVKYDSDDIGNQKHVWIFDENDEEFVLQETYNDFLQEFNGRMLQESLQKEDEYQII